MAPVGLENLLNQAEEALASGSLDDAEKLASKALDVNPLSERALWILGAISEERGSLTAAGHCFEQAIALSPGWWLAYLSKSSYVVRTAGFDAAAKQVTRVYRIAPLNVVSYVAAAELFRSTGEKTLSLEALHRALCCDPANEQGWRILSEAQHQLAIRSVVRAVNVAPVSVLNRIVLGNALLEQKPEAALLQYQVAAVIAPDNAKATYNIGLVLMKEDTDGKAGIFFAHAAHIDPTFAEAHYNCANIFAARNEHSSVLNSIDKALALLPADSRFLMNRGNALFEKRQIELSIRQFKRSLVIRPSAAETYGNLAVAYQEAERYELSLAMHDAALCLRPDWIDGYWNKSISLLQSGDWSSGWRLYEWRWQRDTEPSLLQRNFSSPVWRGESSLHKKTLLLHTEQGLGDSIQMARFVRSLDSNNKCLIIEAEKPLLRLFATLGPDIRVIERGDPLPRFDFHCPLMSLPLALRITPDNIPNPPPYFEIPDTALIDWQRRLGPKNKPRVGIMWRGGTNIKLLGRSIDLRLLTSILDDDFEWISLQKALPSDDLEIVRQIKFLRHFGDEQNDFFDAAALCVLCDLVITIDTSIAHLAGALGRPTWILLQKHADWRWFRDRSDSPWYPSAKLFRQNEPGDWTKVLCRVSEELSNYPFVQRFTAETKGFAPLTSL
jgi:tetratricopeptide (TPR) repeat protein